MKLNIWQRGLLVVLVVGVALAFGSAPVFAGHDPFPSSPGGVLNNGYVEDPCHDFSKCGYNGPLLWNPYTIVASGIAWTKKHWEIPMLHGTRRGSELSQNDFVVPECFGELIAGKGRVGPEAGGAANDGIVSALYGGPYPAPYSNWPIPEAEWLASFPDTLNHNAASPPTFDAHPVNVLKSNENTTALPPTPDNYGVAANSNVGGQGGAFNRCDRSSYKQLMYGGYQQRQGQYQNLPQRLKTTYDRNMPGSLIWDFSHMDAFKNGAGDVRVTAANAGFSCPQQGQMGTLMTPVVCSNVQQSKRDSEILSDPDALGNVNSMYDAGFSRGLGYNLYSLGLATQANGLLSEIGGHNMQSNTGFRKMNIYNVDTNTWYPRPHPCQRIKWEADRYGKDGSPSLGYNTVADAVAGVSPGGGDSLVNPPQRPFQAMDGPIWNLAQCNQHIKAMADPADPSDMRYWRWYPAASMLPNGMVVTYGGDDRDTLAPACIHPYDGVGNHCKSGTQSPSPTSGLTDPTSNPGIDAAGNREPGLNGSTIQVPVMDVWDGSTDTQTALENARKVYPLYPMSAARETGPGWDDWDFCTVGGESAPAIEATYPRDSSLDESHTWALPPYNCPEPVGCAGWQNIAITNGAGGGGGSALDCLDILGAMADSMVNVPAEHHWGLHTRSHNRYPYSNPMVDQTIVGANGKTTSHKLWLIGGSHPSCTSASGYKDPDGNTCLTTTPPAGPGSSYYYNGEAGGVVDINGNGRLIEVIELSDGNGGPAVNPKWSLYAKLVQTTSASHALALPDGNILSSGGGGANAADLVNTTGECGSSIGPLSACPGSSTGYSLAVNLRNQIICVQPASYCETGKKVQLVGQMTVPRAGIHGVYHLLHTAEALQSAYDRTAISRANNRQYTPGDADLAVNSSQIFTPPYLYDSTASCPASVGCKLAQRPVICKGPDHVQYGDKFKLDVDDSSSIKQVSLLRTGSATHTLAQDQLYVSVPFTTKKDKGDKDKDKDKDKDSDKCKDSITVTAPTKPVQAKPGDYMLFTVNTKGTPSMAKHVRIEAGGSHKNYVHLFTKPFPGDKKGKDKDKDD